MKSFLASSSFLFSSSIESCCKKVKTFLYCSLTDESLYISSQVLVSTKYDCSNSLVCMLNCFGKLEWQDDRGEITYPNKYNKTKPFLTINSINNEIFFEIENRKTMKYRPVLY